jgi:hypothetical protein
MHNAVHVLCICCAKPCAQALNNMEKLGDRRRDKEKAARRRLSQQRTSVRSINLVSGLDQAVSPYTVTVMSTTTSVWSATLTVLSPTTLIGPLGIRTCDLATL